MFYAEPADYPMTQSEWMNEAHAIAVAHGGPVACPFDCYACERRMMQHDHRAACGHTVVCDSEECFEDERGIRPLVACWDCHPAPREDVRCAAHADPWADDLPF